MEMDAMRDEIWVEGKASWNYQQKHLKKDRKLASQRVESCQFAAMFISFQVLSGEAILSTQSWRALL